MREPRPEKTRGSRGYFAPSNNAKIVFSGQNTVLYVFYGNSATFYEFEKWFSYQSGKFNRFQRIIIVLVLFDIKFAKN